MRYDSPEIRVTLWPDEEPGAGKYCAIVMDYQECWYNTGIVCRADTPEEAFKKALARFEVEREDAV